MNGENGENSMVNQKRVLLMLSTVILMLLAMPPPITVRAQNQPLFKVTVIAPGMANLLRRQWGQMFANSLQEVGINASVVFLGWAEVDDRVLTPPPDKVGKTYDEGGYDILLVGWTPGLFPEPRQMYYGSPDFLAPNGPNYYLWDNPQSNQLLDTFITSTEIHGQNQSLQEWQSVYFNEIPASQIFYSTAPALVTPELLGYDWIYFNEQCNPEYLKGKTSVVYASVGEIMSLIPPLSNSWYDTIVTSPIYNGLAQVNNAKQVIPALLTSWTPSNNGFKWTFNLRTGVKWHDGYDFTADDILFTIWALMNPDTASQHVGYYRSVYGNNVKFTWQNGTSTTLGTGVRIGNITALDSTTVEVWLPETARGKPYGYLDPYLLTFANNIIPKHIFEKIPVAQWSSSALNTGMGSTTVPGIGTYTGPVGTGPYKWVGLTYDGDWQIVHLQKFNDYWNKTALEDDGLYGVTDYYIKFINDKNVAIEALKNDEVDMLDPNYFGFEPMTPGVIDPSWGKVFNLEGTGRQEIGYNMRHPVLGSGIDTPLGRADPSRAAEAARYVRIAFDYAIQRQQMIDDLLKGFGQPAATPITPTQPYFNASITPRPYNLSKAKEYLEKAGFTTGPSTIAALKTKIEELGLKGEIDKGAVKSLIAKLDLTQKMVDKGEIEKAKAVLEKFIAQVQKLSGIHMTPQAAEILVKSAEYIMYHL
jgi:ABC-type transport system substrate-binding protein